MNNLKYFLILFIFFNNLISAESRSKSKLLQYKFRNLELYLPARLTENINYLKANKRKYYTDNRFILCGSNQNTSLIADLIAKDLSTEIIVVDGLKLVTLYQSSGSQNISKVFRKAFDNQKLNKKVTIVFKDMDLVIRDGSSFQYNLACVSLCMWLDRIEKENLDIKIIITCEEEDLNVRFLDRFGLNFFKIGNPNGITRKSLLLNYLKECKLDFNEKELIQLVKISKTLSIDDIKYCVLEVSLENNYREALFKKIEQIKAKNSIKKSNIKLELPEAGKYCINEKGKTVRNY